MHRSPWELDAHLRYKHADIVSERQRCFHIDQTDAGSRDRLTQLRRRVGIGLIQIGTTIAGRDALPTAHVWPELANH